MLNMLLNISNTRCMEQFYMKWKFKNKNDQVKINVSAAYTPFGRYVNKLES